MSSSSRDEIEAHFARWREAVDRRDLGALGQMLSEDVRGGNAIFGISEGRDAVMRFMERWPESVPNESLWVVIDGPRVVNKWRETLPGAPPAGVHYHYDGITELHYDGAGRWDFMYGLPDVVALQRAYARWKADGHLATHGDLYPGL